MKKFKKLIPALCMLLVSAVMLGTTTFAWFSMNNKVTATGMTVEAKANTLYAVIAQSGDLQDGKIKTGFTQEKATYTKTESTDLSRYPIAYNKTESALTVGTTSVPSKSFYTANSTDRDTAGDATTNTGVANGKVVTFDSNENNAFCKNYAVKYTFYLGITSDSEKDYNGNVKAYCTLTGEANINIRAYVVVADATTGTYFEATVNEAGAVEIANSVTLGKDGTCVKVDIYLFIDGNSTGVTTTGTLANMKGSAEFGFVLDQDQF